MKPVYILAGARTPFATWARGTTGSGGPGGALKERDPFDLGAAAIKGALSRAALAPRAVDRVVFGNMYHAGSHACYGARYAALRAGIPPEVPGLTVSMACGSGLHALIAAAKDVAAGEAGLVAVAGADSVSQLRRDVFVPSFNDLSVGLPIGRTVEDLARAYGLGRAAQDDWALRSHRLAREAQRAGRLAEEIVPVDGAAEDDHVLREPGPEAFAAAKPSYGEGGAVTAANTHGIVDGGSALLLASEERLKAWGREPLGRVAAGAYAAVPPDRMGYAAVPAVRAALKVAGLEAGRLDLVEFNETFAAQMLIDLKELALPPEKANLNGGSIALGHPFAASGGRLVLGLLLELRRRGLKRGAASISIGGGQGVAVVVERP